MESLLTRKDVQARYGVHRTTVYRWERDGLRFRRGRITDGALAWWIEQSDAAKKLGMKVLEFLQLPRRRREKLLQTLLQIPTN